jgi:hypothetical protein
MQFDEYQDLLEEFVDGELDSETHQSVATHVAGCIECAHEVETLRRELELYARYDRGVEVRPELWAGIASTLAAEREQEPENAKVLPFRSLLRHPQRNFIISAIAASVLLAALVAAPIMLRDELPADTQRVATEPVASPPLAPVDPPRRDGTNEGAVRPIPSNIDVKAPETRIANKRTPKRSSQRQTDDTPTSTPLVAVQSAEREYKRAIEVLSRDTDKARRSLTPELRDQFDKTIATLDRNIQGTRAAVYENPKDPIAAQFMMTAYQQKVETLQDIASLSTRIHDGQ